MKDIINFSLLALLLALVWIGLNTTHINEIPQYKYFVIGPTDLTLERDLNIYGNEGCVIDSARRASDGDLYNPTMNYELIMRCPMK